jgi:hypothetical protein
MNAEEYSAQQAAISQAVARYVLNFSKFFARPSLSMTEWLGLLNLLYPEVQRQREASAALAREFYDSQRAMHHPNLPQHDVLLEGTDFRHFVANMEPARARMSQVDTPQHAVAQVAAQAVREVENAGRRQIIHGVENDQAVAEVVDNQPPGQGQLVRGWARIATGRETCSWCLMLVSRGPVYQDAHTAGLDLPGGEAEQMIASGQDVSEYMKQWHPNCDCKVVPVYKLSEWDGRHAWKRAEQLWIDATKEAQSLIDSGDARTNNLNRETLNALRRRIDRGDISQSEWSALTAA